MLESIRHLLKPVPKPELLGEQFIAKVVHKTPNGDISIFLPEDVDVSEFKHYFHNCTCGQSPCVGGYATKTYWGMCTKVVNVDETGFVQWGFVADEATRHSIRGKYLELNGHTGFEPI